MRHRESTSYTVAVWFCSVPSAHGDAPRMTWRVPSAIDIEVRLITALPDGIGLQWLLDPSADGVA
jgi:hypothetical protein